MVRFGVILRHGSVFFRESAEDYLDFYFNKVLELIARTESDPKNRHRTPELEDEKAQLYLPKAGEVPDSYITGYWGQYTAALSV